MLTDKQKEIRAKWSEALRSGNYHQGKHVLHSPSKNTHCCLGVLCEVVGFTFADDAYYIPESKYPMHAYIPEQTFRELTGFDNAGVFSHMNDFENKPFCEIADYIDRTLT